MTAKERGNAAFKAGDCLNAKELYSSALLENPSDAVLWSNRSAAHLSLNCPHVAAADAIRAVTLDSTYAKGYYRLGCALVRMSGFRQAIKNFETCLQLGPDPLVTKKLNDARKQLEKGPTKLQSESDGKCSSFYCPSTTSMTSPSAANLQELNATYGQHSSTHMVDIKPCKEHGGLGLFVQEDVAKEGIVILEESPLLALSIDPSCCVICAECLSDASVTCETCLAERYCSESCRQHAWDTYHRIQCGRVANAASSLRSELHKVCEADGGRITTKQCHVLAASRIAGVLMQGGFSGGLYAHPEFCNLHSLTDTSEPDVLQQISYPFKSHYSQWKMFAEVLDLDALGQVRFDFDFYENLMHILKGNLINVSNASVLARRGSFANHNCEPNAAISFSGGKISLQTLRPLRKGEEVLISYVDAGLARSRRRELLLDGYWFTCKCSRCEKAAAPTSTVVTAEEDDDWLHESIRMMPMLHAMLSGQPAETQLRAICSKYGWDGKAFCGIGSTTRDEFESDFRAIFVAAGF